MSKTRLNITQLKTLGSDDLATDSEVLDVINEHINSTDPHPQYNALGGTYIATNQKGANDGVASLGSDGVLVVNELPSLVGNFLKYTNFSSLPNIGLNNVYYITLNDNKHYVWANNVYEEVVFGWKDLISNATPRSNGVYAATLKEFTPRITEYAYSVGDKCEIRFHLPHDYVPNTDIFLHIHWSHNGTNISGTFALNCYAVYAKGHQQASFEAEVSVPITIANLNITDCPKYMHRVEEVQFSSKNGVGGLLNTDTIEVDSFILLTFEVTSIPSISGSTYTNEPYIIGMDIHYQCIGLSTKNKSPNFYA